MQNDFEKCLPITLKWEGGYSHDADDPGGATEEGITHIEYDAERRKWGLPTQDVRKMTQAEMHRIYREDYWEPLNCDALPAGLDLSVFDAGVNSGTGRAKQWLEECGGDINRFNDLRLAYLQRLGHLWTVFGRGWARRVAGIRADSLRMAGGNVVFVDDMDELHAGMRGDSVRDLQSRLRAKGYPVGAIDGVYGVQLYRAVVQFQADHELKDEPGVWFNRYDAILKEAAHALPGRADVTHKDLELAGDKTVHHLNWMQRTFAWIFGGSAVAQAVDGDSVMDNVTGLRNILDPLTETLHWMASNKWLFVAAGCVGLIAIVRRIRDDHVHAYRNFDYQGPPAPDSN
jgi:hypothetical protein